MQGDPAEQALAYDLERTVELRFANHVGRYVHATNSPLGLPADPELAAELRSAMTQALEYLQTLLADGRDWLGGERVSIADITLQSALQFARFAKVDVIDGYECAAVGWALPRAFRSTTSLAFLGFRGPVLVFKQAFIKFAGGQLGSSSRKSMERGTL